MVSIARMDTKPGPEVAGTYPGHHPQPIGRNRVFELKGLNPPLKVAFKL